MTDNTCAVASEAMEIDNMTSSTSVKARDWMSTIPVEIRKMIYSHLSSEDKMVGMNVSSQWRQSLSAKEIWREIEVTDRSPMSYIPTPRLKRAIAAAQGGLRHVRLGRMVAGDAAEIVREVLKTNGNSLVSLFIAQWMVEPGTRPPDIAHSSTDVCIDCVVWERIVHQMHGLPKLCSLSMEPITDQWCNSIRLKGFNLAAGLQELRLVIDHEHRHGLSDPWPWGLAPSLQTLILQRVKEGPTLYLRDIYRSSPHLKRLCLSNFDLSDDMSGTQSLHHGLESFTKLEYLRMDDCICDLDGGLPGTLETLRIHDGDMARDALDDWARSNLPNLQDLDLDTDGADLDIVYKLLDIPRPNGERGSRASQVLRRLVLHAAESPEDYDGDPDDYDLVQALMDIVDHFGRNLEQLTIHGPSFTDADIAWIAGEASKLKSLTIRNAFELEGGRLEAYIKEHRCSLTELRLWACPVSPEFIIKIRDLCTKLGIRFEWLNKDLGPSWDQAPMYNWLPRVAKSDRDAEVRSVFELQEPETWDWEYTNASPDKNVES